MDMHLSYYQHLINSQENNNKKVMLKYQLTNFQIEIMFYNWFKLS